jgi:hypothetical protein
MISGSCVAPFYYGLMCEKLYFFIYTSIVCFFCTIAVLAIMNPELMNSKSNWETALAFILAGLSTLPGVVHMS